MRTTAFRARQSRRRRMFGLLGLLLLISQAGCIWDPNLPNADKVQEGPPMALLTEVSLPQDAHALFIESKKGRAYICALSGKKDSFGKPKFGLHVVDLDARRVLWQVDDTACFFTTDATRLYVIKEDPEHDSWLLQSHHLDTGQLLFRTRLNERKVPFGISGPGRAIHQSETPENPWLVPSLQVKGQHLLLRNMMHAWVIDAQTGRLALPLGMDNPSEFRQDIFAAALGSSKDGSKALLYVVMRIRKPLPDAVALDPILDTSPGTNEEHTLRVIDLSNQQIVWQKRGLPSPMLRARIAIHNDRLMLQLGTTYHTFHEPDAQVQASGFHSGPANTYENTSLHYLLNRHDGSQIWSKPWVLRHDQRTYPLDATAIVGLTENSAYIHARQTLYTIDLAQRRSRWHRWTKSTQPGQITVFRDGLIFYYTPHISYLLQSDEGTEVAMWSGSVLPPPLALAGATAPPKEIFSTRHDCIRVDGTQREQPIPESSPSFYEGARKRGFFGVFCAKNILQVTGERFVGKYSTRHSKAEITVGAPELTFQYKDVIFTIADKTRLLGYQLPQ